MYIYISFRRCVSVCVNLHDAFVPCFTCLNYKFSIQYLSIYI